MLDLLRTDVQAWLGILPGWAQSLIIFAVALLAAFFAHRLLFEFLSRVVEERDLFWRSLVSRSRIPLMLAMIMFAMMAASALAPITFVQASGIRHALVVALIFLVAMVVNNALHIWTTVHLRRFKLDSEDNLLARKHVTQSRILRRVASILLIIIALAAALMTFEGVRQYGVSLLASAGAAGIILGLALQTVLRNLFAGIQLAITQPIRIDDVVIVEGEWGNIEEITSTYVVVRVWDQRRLIVPLSYFIENPFQNWTRESADIMGTVIIYLDYAAPVSALREKAREIVTASPIWDGRVFAVQVTEFEEFTMQVRILVSARNAGNAFDLRCEVREKLIDFLQKEHPEALPRMRGDNASGRDEGGESAAAITGNVRLARRNS